MIHTSTILIADISGFTDFISSTALAHSSHITNELLTLIVESNTLGLTVSEIEGDAVLFYKIGEAIPCSELVEQCISMFEKFHEHLKVIDRDAICKCGTCQGTSNLGLKFVAHFGEITEINIASFTKASGLDMIISHRLLKNEIAEDEYVLVSEAYRKELNWGLGCDLAWVSVAQKYDDIGVIDVHHACLDEVRQRIPDPPGRPKVVIPIGDDKVAFEVDAPLFKVYASLIDVDKKAEWVVGLDSIENHTPIPRVEQRHTCFFQGMGIDFELLKGEITSGAAVYSERADFRGMPFEHQQTYTLTRTDQGKTAVRFEVKWGDDPSPPDEMREQFMGGIAASFEVFKTMLEA
jgi:uncharacterized protein YndB with AHSA1/START domain